MKRKPVILFLILIMVTTIFAVNGYAAEKGNYLTKELKESVIDAFDKAGLDQDTRIKILNKLEKGELLDSQNPEMVGKGKEEKSTVLDKNGTSYNVTRITFPDGSVTIQSIGGGTSNCGSGYCYYTGSKVSHFSGVTYASFLTDYTTVRAGYGYSSIQKVYEWSISGVGSVSNIELILDRPNETAFQSAYAYLRFTGTVPGDAYTTTFYLRFYVENGQASAVGNW